MLLNLSTKSQYGLHGDRGVRDDLAYGCIHKKRDSLIHGSLGYVENVYVIFIYPEVEAVLEMAILQCCRDYFFVWKFRLLSIDYREGIEEA